jgi:hypothetical protein
MAVIVEHPNDMVRDQYLMEVADRCRVDPARLRAGEWRRESNGAGAAPGTGGRVATPARAGRLPSGPELEALRLAVRRPEAVAERLDETLFADELCRAVYQALASAATLHEAIAAAEPEAADLLQRLAVEDTEEDPDDVTIRLLERAGARVLADLQSEARSSAAPEEYAAVIGWLKLALEELRDPQSGGDAEARLVPWLVARCGGTHE